MKKNFLKKAVALAMTATMIVPNYAIAADAATSKSGTISGEYNDASKWSLVWSDEFNGNQVDTTKWAFETGGAYNNEQQYYTKENATVSDGTLKITAKKESKGGYAYTSSRLETITENGQSLFSTKYGKVEARIKLPAGTGLWPAFWMQPVNNEYGSWPLSGEIDIMEVRGRVLNEANGALHFGEKRPYNKSLSGTYTFPTSTDITDYHVYGIEWKENVIIWYVDGVEFFRASNWYTKNDGVVAEYPAPFNQEFYLILNLAVGGDYDGGKTPLSSELPGVMEVDYVRVYHNKAGYSSENIYMPEGYFDEEAMAKTPIYEGGNLLSDINFTTLNTSIVDKSTVDMNTHDWYLLTSKYDSGKATASKEVINGKTFAKIDITDPGADAYAVQLKQLLPLAYGYTYKVSFDAKCDDGSRSFKVKPIGEGNYCSSYTANLTKELQSYEFEFTMEKASDLDATLEFNLGKYSGDITIGNIKVTVVETYNPAPKVPEAGKTEEETTKKEEVTEKPTEAPTEAPTQKPTESETTNGVTEEDTTVDSGVIEEDTTVDSGVTEEETTVIPDMPEEPEETVITSAVENGDFSQGMKIWKTYNTSYAMEQERGNLYSKVYAQKMSNAWDRQFVQKGIYLTEGKTYKLQFRAKCSSSNQKFGVVIEDANYDKDLSKEFTASKSWKTYTYEFTVSKDGELSLKYFLGMVNKSCKLYLDDVSITIVE